ncbi:hypothetical protein PMAYCL1PPCAC_19872, partial [Pristionchus mayeri]
ALIFIIGEEQYPFVLQLDYNSVLACSHYLPVTYLPVSNSDKMAFCWILIFDLWLQTFRWITSAGEDDIIVEKVLSKRIVTLNRPKVLNALNFNMIRDLHQLLKKWNNDERVSLVIVKGAGGKAFCAGGDVRAVCESAQAGSRASMHVDFFREEYELIHLIGTLRKPYISIMDGITMGAGCGLSVNGRYRVATERTVLAMPEVAIGLFPSVGCSYSFPQLKNNLGLYMALTGFRLHGADALHAGLATHLVNSGDIILLEKALIDVEHPTGEAVDEILWRFQPKEIPPFSLEEKMRAIKNAFKLKSIEEIISKLEEQGDEWAMETVTTLKNMSPTSLKVAIRQMERGARMPYADVLQMEHRLALRCMEAHDVHEGCRAIIVDKDNKPRWRPRTLEEVTDEHVESFFAPLSSEDELILKEN